MINESIRGDVLTPQMKNKVNMAKGDRGGFNFETPERSTILSHLIAKGFIDDWQEDYVWTFMELRHAWLKGSNFKTNALFSRQTVYSATPMAAGEFYDLVALRIKKSINVVLLVIKPYRPMVIFEVEAYRQAIDKLCSTMDDVKKILAERVDVI